jgi:hypothetical protein
VRARKSNVSVGLSPFSSIKLAENLVNLGFAQSEEKQQGGAFDAAFNLLAWLCGSPSSSV